MNKFLAKPVWCVIAGHSVHCVSASLRHDSRLQSDAAGARRTLLQVIISKYHGDIKCEFKSTAETQRTDCDGGS